MIHRAKFQNFKALRNVEVTFDSRLTVLVGPNGSGKTSVLQGIDWLLLLGLGVPFLDAANYRSDSLFLRYHPEEHILLELAGRADLDGSDVGLRMELRGLKERGVSGLQNDDVTVLCRGGATDGKWIPVNELTQPLFRPATFAQLDPGRLAAPTHPTGGAPTITPRGEGLASALAGVALNDPDSVRQIVRHLQSIVRHVRGIRFNRYESDRQEREPAQPENPQVVQLRTRKHITESLVFDFVTARGVSATEVSDGTLIVLGMLALIYAYPNSAVFLCDDLDHGIHPKAQLELVGLLRGLLREFPHLQIIATSHSPFILDRLKPQEVRVMTLRDDGSAVCAPLTSHPEFERWKESMSPGEFWSTFYEDWLTRKPEPQPAQ